MYLPRLKTQTQKEKTPNRLQLYIHRADTNQATDISYPGRFGPLMKFTLIRLAGDERGLVSTFPRPLCFEGYLQSPGGRTTPDTKAQRLFNCPGDSSLTAGLWPSAATSHRPPSLRLVPVSHARHTPNKAGTVYAKTQLGVAPRAFESPLISGT